jgi:hypothetical protein
VQQPNPAKRATTISEKNNCLQRDRDVKDTARASFTSPYLCHLKTSPFIFRIRNLVCYCGGSIFLMQFLRPDPSCLTISNFCRPARGNYRYTIKINQLKR